LFAISSASPLTQGERIEATGCLCFMHELIPTLILRISLQREKEAVPRRIPAVSRFHDGSMSCVKTTQLDGL
jgi:hypothetical protein